MNIVKLDDFIEQTEQQSIAECTDSLQLVEKYFEQSEIKWGFCRFTKDKMSLTPSELNTDFQLWMQRKKVDVSFHKPRYVKAALTQYDMNMYDAAIEQLRENLKYDATLSDEFVKLNKYAQFSDDDILIFKSWVWNVKRTINHLEKEQVPMPLLFSTEQRYGKSTFNQKLYEPVAELSLRRDVSSIRDSFGNGLWRKLLVVDFDEISSINGSMLSKFKEWCYADKVAMRNPNTSTMLQFEKVTNAIASSNVDVSDILKDSTGSRRIWQVNLKKSLFDALEYVDFEKLWRCVDENAECPLYVDNHIERITQIQYETQRSRSSVEIWLDEFRETNVKESYKALELFALYDSWRKVNKEKSLSSTAFGRQVVQFGIERRRKNSGNYYFFDV
ncbi:Whole genome shotgun sequence [Vibrio chagasii]|nr:Whole genome shotgun sequence [Vibrio chagasii]